MLRYRLASAIVLIPVILGAVILGGPVYFALALAGLLVCGYEFYQMAEHAGYHPYPILGLALVTLFVWDAYARTFSSRDILSLALVVSLVIAIYWRREGWIAGWALTFAGALYIGVLGAYFILMRSLPDGQIWTAGVLLTTWATDTAAYAAGHRFGRHGFFTSISPKKTWEGAIGGWVAAIVVMFLFATIAGLAPLYSIGLGTVVGLAATFGDLAESVLKRQFGAKDSGALVPGHGGLLDRADSLLFAGVFAYYSLVWALHLALPR